MYSGKAASGGGKAASGAGRAPASGGGAAAPAAAGGGGAADPAAAAAGGSALPNSPPKYNNLQLPASKHVTVAEFPASLDFAMRDNDGKLILGADNTYGFTRNKFLLFSITNILKAMNKETLSHIISYIPELKSSPPTFEICAFICAVRIIDNLVESVEIQKEFKGPIKECWFIMLYRLFTKFGRINKLFVEWLNYYVGQHDFFKPRSLHLQYVRAGDIVDRLPYDPSAVPTGEELTAVQNQQFYTKLYMKMEIPGLTGDFIANASRLQIETEIEDDAAAFLAAQKYLENREDKVADDITIKAWDKLKKDGAFVTAIQTIGLGLAAPENMGLRSEGYNKYLHGLATMRQPAHQFAFKPGGNTVTALAEYSRGVAGGGGSAAAAAAPAPASASGHGAAAGAGAGAAEEKSNSSNSNSSNSNSEEEEQGGGSRTKKRKYRSSHQKRKSQRSRKSQKKTNRKTRSRR